MQPDGPNSEEIIKNNQALILETFRARLAEVTNAGMLDGIIVHAEMPYVLGVSIEGPEENIKALREFIKIRISAHWMRMETYYSFLTQNHLHNSLPHYGTII